MPPLPKAKNLQAELEVIASEELADVLAAWGEWTPDQARRLRDYLIAELCPNGMLSVEKGREAGQGLGVERKEARGLIARL